jgi:hypothetical protein
MTEGTRRQAVSNLVDTNTLIERICLTSGIGPSRPIATLQNFGR